MVEIKTRLLDESFNVEVRASGMATFLFVRGNGRCVEISPVHGSNWWVEYWDDDDLESTTEAVRDEEFTSVDPLIGSVITWLQKK